MIIQLQVVFLFSYINCIGAGTGQSQCTDTESDSVLEWIINKRTEDRGNIESSIKDDIGKRYYVMTERSVLDPVGLVVVRTI